jgi:hypothetical protein
MKKRAGNKILIAIIIVLALILGYGIYGGLKAREIISNLESENAGLASERNSLRAEMDSLQDRYHLLEMDVSKIYKTCPYENACKGRFPMISWYCNSEGASSPDTANAPYICVCNADCQLNQTAVQG